MLTINILNHQVTIILKMLPLYCLYQSVHSQVTASHTLNVKLDSSAYFREQMLEMHAVL